MSLPSPGEPDMDEKLANEPVDLRVLMVLQVLGGADAVEVAHRWNVDVELVRRWVTSFVDSGTAAVTNRPLANAARERDRFLSAFAHELRTPLTVAHVWMEMITADDATPQLQVRGLAALQRALSRLTHQVREIELLAAASLGRVELQPERVSIETLTSRLPADASIELGPGATHVVVDPEKFEHVVAGLWRAASVPPEPRSLRLEAFVVEPWVEIRVTREAAPLDTELLHALFEPFSSVSANGDVSGVTTGLYLARALVTAHGGTIGLDQDDDRLVVWVRIRHQPEPVDPRQDGGPAALSVVPAAHHRRRTDVPTAER